MGSVKDLIVIEEPTERPGIGRFIFSDRYSVFDYGEMPDKIENKGKSLCIVSAYFFEKLEDAGLKTHYMGLIENDRLRRFDEIEEAVDTMQIKLVRVFVPKCGDGYNYSIFRELKGNFLLPLEVIYRNSVPEGSSLLRRLEKGEVKPQDFGLDEIKPNQKLKKPIVDFSTKLEDVDRYLSYEEAKEISGLSDEEFEELKSIVLKVDEIISREVAKTGLENEDGKIEIAFDENRRFMIVDAVGTPDECRFSHDGFEVSKEILRKFYRKTEWYESVKKYKGAENWRDLVGRPPQLPRELRTAISELYMSFCNEVTGRRLFDVPRLKEVVKKLRELV
jgi:phosphoribosylaminoimidazole-succinocarboxamide synthase